MRHRPLLCAAALLGCGSGEKGGPSDTSALAEESVAEPKPDTADTPAGQDGLDLIDGLTCEACGL